MINPILELEMKTRMRTWKTPILLTVFLFIIGGILMLFFMANSLSTGFGAYGFDPSIVSTIYDFLAVTLMCMLIIIIPIFTATAISGERERQTLELLLCTDFSPWKIISGKMSAALCFVFLMIVATMPFMGVTMLFGGISILDILNLIFYYLGASIMMSSIGMFATTHFKKNLVSIIMSYVIMGALYLIPIVIMIILAMIESYSSMYGSGIGLLDGYIYEIIVFLFSANPVFGIISLLNNDLMDMSSIANNSNSFIKDISPWIISMVYFAMTSTFFILLSKRKLGKIK